MIVLYCLLGLLALIVLLLFVPIKVRIKVSDKQELSVRVSAATFPIFTQPEKKKAFRMRDYSPAAIDKRKRKQERALAKAKRKQAAKKKATQPSASRTKQTTSQKIAKLTDTLSLVFSLVEKLHGRLLGATHIHLHRLILRIGSSDAAKTAVLYGAICPTLSGLLALLHEKTNLHLHHPQKFSVEPDFVNNTFYAELDLTVQLRVRHAIALTLSALVHLIKHKQARRAAPSAPTSPTPQAQTNAH